MRKKKILITGGAGFVGGNLARYFSDKAEVIVMDNLVRRGSEINIKTFDNKIKFFHGDIRNKEDFRLLPKVDVILDTSAQASAITGYDNPRFDFTNNTFGVLNCLEKAREDDAIFIFWSTNKVYSADKVNMNTRELKTRHEFNCDNKRGFDIDYGINEDLGIDGNDHSIYGVSKAMSDLMVQEYGNAFNVRTIVNRFSCLAGQGQFGKSEQGWVSWWVLSFMFNLGLEYIGWSGKQVRDVLFIDDLCRLIDMQIENINDISGEVFNIGGGIKNTLSLIEATELMKDKFNKDNNTTIIDEPRKADHCVYISDIRKIKNAIGWEPETSISDGFDKIIEWTNKNKEELKRLYLR